MSTLRRATATLALVNVLAACGSQGAATTSLSPSPTSEATDVAASRSAAVDSYDINGHRLFMECRGTTVPTVLFMHGLGGTAADWQQSVSLLGDRRTCVYDRINAGRSGRALAHHTASEGVAELHELLAAAGETAPYLLVGHSFGGELALMYAATYPSDVVGVVLADATLPLEAELFPADIRNEVRAAMDRNEENIDFYEAYAEADALLPSLPDVPITYMQATLEVDLPPEWPEGAYDEALQEFIDGLPRGRLTKELSNHHMPRTIPERIVREAMRILEGPEPSP